MQKAAWHYALMGMTIWFGAPIVATAQEATAPTGLTESTGDISTPSQVNGTGSFSEFQDFADLSIDELLNASISVASGAKSTLRKSPAIVTLVTREQILNSGARDLADVFRLVPGFDLPYDVYGVQGISVRGVYAFEGKVLVLLDGIPLNEYQYTTPQYNYHVAVEQIERIEIIRGPGSVIYGGYAGLGVINIVTQSAVQLDGSQAFVSMGGYESAFGHVVGGAAYGHTFARGLGLHLAVSGGYANASDGTYSDFYGDSYSVPGNNIFRPWMARFGLIYNGLEFDALWDVYNGLHRDGFGEVIAQGPMQSDFRQSAIRLQYQGVLSPKVKIVPSYLFQTQRPWLATGARAQELHYEYDYETWRNTAGLRMEADPVELLRILIGTDYYWEHHRSNTGAFSNGTNKEDYNDMSIYGQTELSWKALSFVGGARYEWHDSAGGAFVPRASLGFVWEAFHAKLLYGRAFRTPSLMNIWSNTAIEPEIVDTYEAELGYQLPAAMFITVNGFVTDLDKPIVYGVDSVGNDNYYNFPHTGSWGLEGQLRYTMDRGYVGASHTFTRPLDNQIPTYHYGVVHKRLLGETDHKFTFDGSWRVWHGLSVNPSAIVYGRRDGFVTATETRTYTPSLLLNGFVRCLGVVHESLELGAGVYNILDDQTPFMMPYISEHAPFPSRGREYVMRLGYRL